MQTCTYLVRNADKTGKQSGGVSIGVPANSLHLTWRGHYITLCVYVCVCVREGEREW